MDRLETLFNSFTHGNPFTSSQTKVAAARCSDLYKVCSSPCSQGYPSYLRVQSHNCPGWLRKCMSKEEALLDGKAEKTKTQTKTELTELWLLEPSQADQTPAASSQKMLYSETSKRYAERFQWPEVAINCMLTTLSSSQLQRSILCAGAGLDSDCSGGAKGFEAAMRYFNIAWARRSWPSELQLNLRPFSVCEKDSRMLNMGSRNLPDTTCKFVDAMDIFSNPNAATLINEADCYEARLFLS